MKQIYPNSLDNYMKQKLSSVVYIPRKLHNGEKLKLFKRYYQPFQELYFKVIEVYSTNDTEYYTIRYQDNFTGTISYPVDNDTYEMLIDRNDITNTNDIINSKESYTGAEIKFWFYSHNIDLDSSKYEGFWSYLSNQSQSEISDDKSYFVKGIINEEGNYIKCKFPLDKSKLIRRKRNE